MPRGADWSDLKTKPGTTYWWARYRGKDEYFGRTDKVSEEDARRAYEQRKAEYAVRDATPEEKASRTTVGALVALFMENVDTNKGSENWGQKQRILNEFVVEFGSRTLKTLKAYEIEKWVSAHKEWNQTSRNVAYRHLAHCFNWLERYEDVVPNIIRKCNKPESKKRSDNCIIYPDELDKILAACKKLYREILTVMWDTGCRPGEALKMSAEMYNAYTQEMILTEHKTDSGGEDRIIKLTLRADKIIQERIALYNTGLLFRSVNGRQISSPVLLQYLKRVCKRLGLKDTIVSYSTRHSFGYHAIKEGRSIEWLSYRLGNTPVVAHRHYAHTVRAMRAADEELRRSEPPKHH